ncbi:HAD-IA family hydrolase [Bosea sp. 2KB_26]|uniref:HAD-IA family hydrolase n=1 Tax=Bosea sp. 2KB_26 TaxID=3237475 RepID=UPI003F90F865
MPRYSLAIFDFDGTLADSFPWFCSVLNETARRFGFREVQEQERDDLRALGSREIVAHLGVPLWKLPAIAAHMRQLNAQSQGEVRLFDGVEQALANLARHGIRIAVVSSNAEETIRRTLGRAADHVSAFDCGASLWGKSAKFKAVAKRLGVPRERAIAIGDELRDIEAARKAGMACGAVTFGYNAPAALLAQWPDLVFTDFADLQAQLTGA